MRNFDWGKKKLEFMCSKNTLNQLGFDVSNKTYDGDNRHYKSLRYEFQVKYP